MKFVEETKEKNSEYKRNVPAGGLKKHSHVVAGGVAAASYSVLNRNVRIRIMLRVLINNGATVISRSLA